jgi:hypothetical protein
MLCVCPSCGYEFQQLRPAPPAKPYEYSGYHRSDLPIILQLLKEGKSPTEISENWYLPTLPTRDMIAYIARRYGFYREDPNSSHSRHARSGDRNREITARYRAGGVTLRKLGEEYGLSGAQVRVIVRLEEQRVAAREETNRVLRETARIEDVPLESLDLPTRVYGAMLHAKCKTVGDAMQRQDYQLLGAYNFSKASLLSWKVYLAELQRKFAEREGTA